MLRSLSFVHRRILPARISLLACAVGLASCATSASSPPVDMTVSWLTERGTIPDDVTGLQFVVMRAGQSDECRPDPDPATDPRCSPISSPPGADRMEVPNSLVRDLDGDGRAEILADELPVGEPITIELRGFDDADRAHVGYVGRVGPFVLQGGERRHVALHMYAAGNATTLDTSSTMPGRFLTTATALRDGRVLVAGGFDVGTLQDCPASLTVESRCFDLTASSDAWLFEPATGRFHPVAGGMLTARGGHTATLLPDGRVLVAGGAAHASLELASIGPSSARALSPNFVPDDTDDTPATFEVFDPALNAEVEDIDADGDPARGGFVGGANDPTTPGALNHGRFMHAAARLPSNSTRVLLAGGVDAIGQGSWEIFDAAKPGGYGVYYAATNALPVARRLPSAITSPDGVWIVGGAQANQNADLADVWSPMGSDPNGRVRSAREFTGARYPNPSGSSEMPRPQYALARPMLGALDGGDAMVVLGWFGPRCASDSPSPAFGAGATDICSPTGGPSRNHTTLLGTAASGSTVATTGAPAMSFGSSAVLDDGSVFIAGGISQSLWRPVTANAVLFEANTMATTGGAARSSEAPTLATGRVFAVSAAIPGRGVLTVGGITSNTWDSLTFVPNSEVWYRSR